jgi:acetaldehyde dehydrogenase/alcohol dehydrogenase
MATVINDPAAAQDVEWAARLDGFVERAQKASTALRELDQEAVDRIVWAMTVAGLEHAVELAELAMEETHFGVLEDKVIKNYIATEFLYDYLKDKKSVGVIDEDPERALEFVAEPIGVVLALLPITNPTSTALFKSIVCSKTRNALIMRPSAAAARCAARAGELMQEAGEAVGLPPYALQVIPDPSLDVSQYLFHHPGVDFIWTTGGPKAVAAANAAGKPCLSVGPGNAPVYVHRSANIRMAVTDVLISKTFDSSVICPAEQTCVIDEQIYDQVIEEFQRMGSRLLTDEQTGALAARSFSDDGKVQLDVLGQSCVNLAGLAGFEASGDDKVPAGPAPDGPRRPFRTSVHRREADARARRGALAIGRTRDPCVRAGHGTRWPGPHLGRLCNRRGSHQSLQAGDPNRADPRQCADGSRSPGRHLQLDAPDLAATRKPSGSWS